mmetsp:Transcript_4654/g.7052  ORF Transcript_4654/g.7052 Transcript_4654/m.7052 type:complete len:114 (+) Transcript_4654:209-550(+)
MLFPAHGLEFGDGAVDGLPADDDKEGNASLVDVSEGKNDAFLVSKQGKALVVAQTELKLIPFVWFSRDLGDEVVLLFDAGKNWAKSLASNTFVSSNGAAAAAAWKNESFGSIL